MFPKVLPLAIALAVTAGACADDSTTADSPLEAWGKVWDDADEELRDKMCGTFRGEVALHTGEAGPTALWEALDEEQYVISLDYDDWVVAMEESCAAP